MKAGRTPVRIVGINQKTLNYEIETSLSDVVHVGVVRINQKTLNYEIETGGRSG